MKFRFLIPILFVVLLSACSSDDIYLEKSIFIEDPEVPGLPIYSESGYNTFGVRYDRDAITNNSSDYPLTVIVKNGKTSFLFKGKKESYREFNLTLTLNDFLPDDEYDLLNLNGRVINLEGDNVELKIEEEGNEKSIEILSGKFEFKKAQNLTVDEEDKGVILSGIFEFKALIDNEAVAFSYGRFDVIIAYSNFFVLD